MGVRVLWLTWKDHDHPEAGGAEVVCRELTARLAREGHAVTILTCGYPGASVEEERDGIRFVRIGSSRYIHPFQALAHYVRRLRGKFDVVIEEVNAAPYFSVLFGGASRRYLLFHQMERKVWFYETRWPLNYIGHYVLEPVSSLLLSLTRVPVITVSESTRRDLARFGFRPERTHIISEGLEIDPAADLTRLRKFSRPTILSHGTVRAMKRTLDQVKAFEIAKQTMPDLQLKISGQATSKYGNKVLEYISRSPYAADIEYLGRTSRGEKGRLMQRCHIITVTSIKEGWGLIVTEAASQGTPAVVYDVDGLRDSVRNGSTGLTTEPTPEALARSIVLLLQDQPLYDHFRQAGWEWSRQITFDKSYQDFKQVLEIA